LHDVWNNWLPDWMGELGSPEFLANYRGLCAFLAGDLRGLVDMWQIANELNLPVFSGPLNPAQACELVESGARGLKESNGSALVGTNTAGTDEIAHYIIGRLHSLPDGLLDYCGVDGYYGSFGSGGPASWAETIDKLSTLSGLRVLINEWGYSSVGGSEHMSQQEIEQGKSVCQVKKWRHVWGGGHTPQVQAEFVSAAYEVFREKREQMLGAFFYSWQDSATCWQCGSSDCPAETGWGLVDQLGNPKPVYGAFKRGVQRLDS